MKKKVKAKKDKSFQDISKSLNTEKIKVNLEEDLSKSESKYEKKKKKALEKVGKKEKIKEKKSIEALEISKKDQGNKKYISISCIKSSFIKHKILYILSIISVIILIIALVVILKFVLKNKQNSKEEKEDKNIDNPKNDIQKNPIAYDVESPLKKEFNINTKLGDLRRISVVQKTKDETKINSKVFKNEITRKTNYDIYFKSEEDASEENQKYYSIIYKGIVSIQSECTAINNDDCEPQLMHI